MRSIAALFALVVVAGFGAGQAQAQSLQCLQERTAQAQAECAEAEMDDLLDRARFWRREASQSIQDYNYFEDERARCRGEAMCLARTLHIEIAELQARLTPARAASVVYTGPVVQRLEGAPNDLHILMDRLLRYDSRGWMLNSYDRGSVRNTRIISRNGSDAVIYADYTYNRGSPGWVRAHVVGGAVTCLDYHDFRGQCRPVGAHSYAYGTARDALLSAFAQAALQAFIR